MACMYRLDDAVLPVSSILLARMHTRTGTRFCLLRHQLQGTGCRAQPSSWRQHARFKARRIADIVTCVFVCCAATGPGLSGGQVTSKTHSPPSFSLFTACMPATGTLPVANAGALPWDCQLHSSTSGGLP